MKLQTAEENREVVERVHGIFANKCPVYCSLRAAIEITSSYEIVN